MQTDPLAFDHDRPTFAFDFSMVPYCRANNHESSDHAKIGKVKHMLRTFAGLLSRNKSKGESKRFVLVLVDIAALAAQATSFVLWPFLDSSRRSLWLIPVALILVSCGWWENYVSTQSRIGEFLLFSGLKSFYFKLKWS